MPESEDLRSIRLTVAVYVVVFAGKVAAYFATGVMAIFAEALHTLSDIFISCFLLVALIWAGKKADREHMLGHGRAQNAAALVAATLFISFTSFKLYEEAVPRLLHPHQAAHQHLGLAIGVLAVSMLIAAAPLVSLLRQKARGAAAKAQYLELINDEMGLLAALIGTLFVMWGKPVADPIAAIFVATIIAVNAVVLFRENLSFLLGRAPEPQLMDGIRTAALSTPGVLSVHNLRAEMIGPDTVHTALHIEVGRGTSIEQADSVASEVKARIHRITNQGYCIVHMDPEGSQAPETLHDSRTGETASESDQA
jgi:cation diffusion facilitator family transporter